uniref:Uncharacterized protein n=1 Tax=Acrobeloides nanus TaxID=290746 RepID=A0A914DQ75_9BILA
MPSKIGPKNSFNDADIYITNDDLKDNHHKNGIDINENIPYPNDDGDGDDVTIHTYEPSLFDKFINILLCRPDLAKQKLEAKPVTLIELFRYAKKFDVFLIFLGTICAICSGVLQPILAVIAGRMITVLLAYPPHSGEFRWAGYQNVYLFLGLGVFSMIVNFFQYMFFQRVCNRIIAKLKHEYVKAIMRQNAGWFDRNLSGTLTTRLNDNIDRIREGMGEKLGLLLRGFAMFIAAVIISFIYQWRLALMMLGVAPATCFIMSTMSNLIGDNTSKEMKGVGKAGAIAEESVLGVKTVQAFNGQETMVKRYEEQLEIGKRFGILKGFWAGLFGGLFFLVLYAFLGCGMLYGGWLLKVGIFTTPGGVFTCVWANLLGAYFLGLVSPQLMVLLSARVSAASIYSTIDRKPKIDVYSTYGKKLAKPVGRVEFKNVHFRYPTRKDLKILNGLNLIIEPGQTVALVGHSGCGKSTSVGLLTRLYEAESGRVLIDGEDVTQLNLNHLRNVVGIVQQEPILFNDTIAENIRMGNPDCTQERMIEVCKMANAHGFIQKLPKKYDTMIGEGGVQLSGGQKQRIAIARTLARDPKVLLLDEATSALDAQSEDIVQSALYNAAKGRSTIMIAHRLSTVKNADKIVFFEKGVIVEQGTHQELVELDGRYAELVKAQQFQSDEDTPTVKITEEELEEEEIDLGDGYESQTKTISLPNSHAVSKFDDISLNSNYGRNQFMRGNSLNDSITRESLRMSIELYSHKAENELFMKQVQEEMDKDNEVNYNLLTVYKNAHGSYLYIVLGFFSAVIRGLELPALSLTFIYNFNGFFYYQTDPDYMIYILSMALIIFIGVGVGTSLFQLLSSTFFAIASESLTLKLRVASFKSILYQDAAYFDNPQHTAGKLITRLASDAPNIKAVVDARMLQVIYSTTAVIVSIIIAFIYSWQIAIPGLGLNALLAFTQILLARIVQKRNLELAKSDDAGKIAIEIIENVKTIQLLTREEQFFKHYVAANKKLLRAEFAKSYFEAINNSVGQSFQYICMCITFAIGVHIISTGQKDQSSVFQAIVAMLLSAIAIMNSSVYFPDFVNANTASGLIFSIIFRKPKTGDCHAGKQVELRGNILFEGVKFTYPQKPNQAVMRDLNFTAIRGQTVALVGPSGSGKSTVISMLERYYDPTGGVVRFDGNDLRTLSLENVRKQMALVGQMPTLFAGSIKENIIFGLEDENISNEQIDQALEIANAKNFVYNFPQGLDTEVGEKGAQMSGGQKQRIAIARALIRNPKILLLDEATSALDSQSEKAVQEALDRAREGRTCITIAHRLSSIQNSDLILYIENGKVRESGTHNELISKRGKYYELIRKQDLAT